MLFFSAIQTLTRRSRQREVASERQVDDRPGCAFGLATRRGLDDLYRDVDRLETKINGLLFGVAATLLAELWRAWH